MAQRSPGSEAVADPLDRLKSEATGLLEALGEKAVTSLKGTVEGATERLTDYTSGGGSPGLKAAAAGAKSLAEGKSPVSSLLKAGTTAVKDKVSGKGGKGGGGGKGKKVTNIIESIDVGVPIRLAYDQWTRFTDYPGFMKKVESVEQEEDEKLSWRAQILWSHRNWESTILEQVPDDKIVWRSEGAKGYVDGAVTFHELAPNLTRILMVLEYHPQGFFEHTGNLWRAQGRRVRLELKHFRRHIMTEAILHADEIEGWRGTISDGEVQQNGSEGNGSKQQAQQGRGRRSGSKSGSDRAESRRRQSAGSSTKSQSSSSQGSKRQGNSSQASSKGSSSQGSSSKGSSSKGSSSQSNGRRSASSSSSSGNGRAGSSSGRGSRRSTSASQPSSRSRKAS
jgi:uncharacterized membrane protein